MTRTVAHFCSEGWSSEQRDKLHLDRARPWHLHSSSYHKLRLPSVHQEELAEAHLPCLWPFGHWLLHTPHTMDNLLLLPLVFSPPRWILPWLF